MEKHLSQKKKLIKNIKKLGIKKGDTVLVHSDLSNIGFVKIDLKSSINILHNSIISIIGDSGTICVPSFYWEFDKKRIFDLK